MSIPRPVGAVFTATPSKRMPGTTNVTFKVPRLGVHQLYHVGYPTLRNNRAMQDKILQMFWRRLAAA